MNYVPGPQTKRAVLAAAVAAAVLQMANQAAAQTAAPAEEAMTAVVVTGSLIRRVANEGATPLVTIKSSELQARGNTELKDLALEMPQSLSLGTNSGAAGPVINLRGLGPMRTLTLLNGRRLANEPLQDQYVSVNVMPRMALDRVETLNGGAASIYGADAIGGVQNFLTKRGFEGVSVKAEYAPTQKGGADSKSVGAILGTGNLSRDGWNAYLAIDYQKKDALFQAIARSSMIRPSCARWAWALRPMHAIRPRLPTSALRAMPTRTTTRRSPPAAWHRTPRRPWATTVLLQRRFMQRAACAIRCSGMR